MLYNTFLKEIFKSLEEDKKLSKSTIKLYLNNLVNLFDKFHNQENKEEMNSFKKIKSFNFLKEVDKILSLIEDLKLSTQIVYISAIINVLKLNEKKNKKLIVEYSDIINKMGNNNENNKKENVKTKTQEKNWMEFSEILKIQNEMFENIKQYEFEENLSEKEFDKLLHTVLLSLYTLIPPRRNKDYQVMYYVLSNFKDMSNKENYIIKNKNNYKVIFNKYKTSNKYGQQEFLIEDKNLIKILNIYFKHHPLNNGKKTTSFKIPFLIKADKKAFNNLSPNTITRILNTILNKKISSSMLRHIYLSYHFGDKLETRKNVAEKMGHSLDMQNDYIKMD